MIEYLNDWQRILMIVLFNVTLMSLNLCSTSKLCSMLLHWKPWIVNREECGWPQPWKDKVEWLTSCRNVDILSIGLLQYVNFGMDVFLWLESSEVWLCMSLLMGW